MMQLLLPLGLLGLLGVLGLILIYIIRPNYLTKHVSSTYVWKLSLKYKKKKLPTSKIRNLLLFICQILILVSMALILAEPAIVYETAGEDNELIAVIDSSMSMYTGSEESNRFTRAVDLTIAESNRVLDAGGRVSVILADDSPYYLCQRVTSGGRSELIASLNGLKEDPESGEMLCSYGTSDLDEAMELSEEVLAENPYAKIKVYTDKSYQYVPEEIEVVSVREEGERNVAILDARAELDDGYYQLTVELASYGEDREVELNVQVHGANAIDSENGGVDMPVLSRTIFCDADQTKTVIFRYGKGEDTQDIFYYDLGAEERFHTFRTIDVYVDEADDLTLDNNFYIYGGLKEVVKVQYASGGRNTVGANPFVNGILAALTNALSSRWDIKITEVQQGADPELSGFDVYIFEHTMPKDLPTDGVVLLFDPLGSPVGSDITALRQINLNNPHTPLTAEKSDHPLLRNLIVENIQVSSYIELNYSNDYEVLMSCNGAPVMLARNDQDVKTAVIAFSVHYSNIAMLPEWPILMYNLFDYFLPTTVEKSSYEVGERFTVNGRGARVFFSGEDEPIEEFPATLDLQTPGTYSFDVTTYFGKRAQTEYIFVRPPAEESNINLEMDTLVNPFAEREAMSFYDDLLVYFAAALVVLLFAEWALHSRDKS